MTTIQLKTAVLAKNDAGAIAVNLLSSPGSGKTALLELLLTRCREQAVPVAALTGDLATENDAKRLARSGVPVRQVVTDGLCHLEADMVRDHLAGWLPDGTRLLLVENVGNLVCPASYDLGESMRVVLASVTEGEDKPVKYPTAYRWADLVVLTKVDLAAACEFDDDAFTAAVHDVNHGVAIIRSSARTGQGVDELLRAILSRLPAAGAQST